MSVEFSAADDFLSAPRHRRTPIAPLLIATALAAVALAGQTRLGAWLRGFLAPRVRPKPRPIASLRDIPCTTLRNQILGRRKSGVAVRFGPPRTAVIADAASAPAHEAGYYRADTWYYAIDPAAQTAMAIRFANGVAIGVDFFGVPDLDA